LRVFLLAGTQEARLLASRLIKKNYVVTASLNGNTRNPKNLGCVTRIGGFGGTQGFRLWLREFQPDIVIDATHPFASSISARTKMVCRDMNIPSILFLRDEWIPKKNDNWCFIDNYEEIKNNIASHSKIFLATGARSLEKFDNLEGCYIFCRKIDKTAKKFPLKYGEFIIGRPPFTIQDELNLFKKLKIDYLVVKNSGGKASESKLKAAGIMDIPVIMLNRPNYSNFNKVNSIDECMDWVSHFENKK
tara:strand:+ start:141 stop:881 length:741 start_codon:yes stop_codon:yes gene_type:complete